MSASKSSYKKKADRNLPADLLAKCQQGTKHFGRTPLDVLADKRLTYADKVLYGVMSYHVWEGNICCAPIRQLALMAAMSDCQVMRSLARLKGLGFIAPGAENIERRRAAYMLVSPVFGQKQGREDVVRQSKRGTKRYTSMDHDRHGMPPREEVA